MASTVTRVANARVAADDRRLTTFVKDALHGAFDTDARLWRSLRLLMMKPGELTAEHMRGRRRIYLSPLQLFLLANLLFFTMISTIGGFGTFTTRLQYHVTMQGYGSIAAEMVERRVPAGTEARRAYEARFDEATPRYANSMVIVMVPLLAVVLYALYGGRRFLAEHVVFSLHLFAWLLCLQVALSLLLGLLFLALFHLLNVSAASIAMLEVNSEAVLGLLMLALILWYVVQALRRSYGDRLWQAMPRALGIAAGLMISLTLYRMLLFFVVFYRVR